jgi:Rho GTPase-activating protein 18/28/40
MNFHKANTSTPYRIPHDAPISFESMIRETEKSSDGSECETIDEVCSDINSIPEGDIKKLQPVLWLELATIFDKHHISLDKRKPFKRKRKEEGNVFGVSLNALVRRDQQVTGEDTSLVPLILQSILRELISRGGAKEEGILRVAGHKQKVRTEKSFSHSIIIIINAVHSFRRKLFTKKSNSNFTQSLRRLSLY